MAGRPKVKLYQYDRNGKYMGSYKCMTEFKKAYKLGAHYPIFIEKKYNVKGYPKLEHVKDDTFVCKERIGRDKLVKAVKIAESPYKLKKKKPIGMYNLEDKQIAKFTSERLASRITGINRGTIASSIKRAGRETTGLHTDYYFKEL